MQERVLTEFGKRYLDQRRRITVEEFGRMAEAGMFGDDGRLELIDGELIVAQ